MGASVSYSTLWGIYIYTYEVAGFDSSHAGAWGAA